MESNDRGLVVVRGQGHAGGVPRAGRFGTHVSPVTSSGGLEDDGAKRLKDLERVNSTFKRLSADAELERTALTETTKGTL